MSCGVNLSQAPKLHRVGASIGHKKSPTLHELLRAHVPEFVTDEEDGITAMFAETHRKFRETTPQVTEALRKTLAHLYEVWKATAETGQQIASATQEQGRAFVEDESYGLKGMWKEFQDMMNFSTSAQSSAPQLNKDASSDGKQFLDAFLANMLHTFVHSKDGATEGVKPQGAETVERVATQPAPIPVPDRTTSMHDMFRQISQKFPSLRSINDVERHLLERLRQIGEESKIIQEPIEEESEEFDED